MPPSVNGTATVSITLTTVPSPPLATKRSPAASNARPSGALSPETRVLTVPAGVTSLTVLPPSATKRLPDESNFSAVGEVNPETKILIFPAVVTLSTVWTSPLPT